MRQVSASLLGRNYRISVEGADDEGKNADDSPADQWASHQSTGGVGPLVGRRADCR
jgi:hypothetical protein